MTKIKLCGLKRPCDITYANELAPDFIGFVFAKGSKRYVAPKEAEALRRKLNQGIVPVGVFVDEEPDVIAGLVKQHIIEAAQLHGSEDEHYIHALRQRTGCTIIKAFRMEGMQEVTSINRSSADYVLLDSGGGSGETFDWSVLRQVERPYFLAGGLTALNVQEAIARYRPFGVDASSCLETQGAKDKEKMAAFVRAVRQGKDL